MELVPFELPPEMEDLKRLIFDLASLRNLEAVSTNKKKVNSKKKISINCFRKKKSTK